jgi:amino acid permease
VRLEVVDQCVRRLVRLVAEGTLMGTGLNVTIANVLHESGWSWGRNAHSYL